MAASIPWNELRSTGRRPLRVLDPMAGSGTTLVVARALGHTAIGFDTDPLAVMLASVWCCDIDAGVTRRAATRVLGCAQATARCLRARDAHPVAADDETRQFVRYWFDLTNRRQLTGLARAISVVRARSVRNVLWCAFSRLIITKQAGASLALDVSHSRPHKVADKTVIRPFDHFLRAVDVVLAAAPFATDGERGEPATVRVADARNLPLPDESVDVVVSSPPYLNAIDYLRGHKFSLVWMGHLVGELRRLRASNIGTEASAGADVSTERVSKALSRMGRIERLPSRQRNLLARYVADMDATIGELARVLIRGGRAVIVVGDCTMRGVFVRNSGAIAQLARTHGLELVRRRHRPLPPNRRYLPPPSPKRTGSALEKRMRAEVLLDLVKS
jgi:hypothetical protein